MYQSDLLENTPGDPDPNDESVFHDWSDARDPKVIDFKIIRISWYATILRIHINDQALIPALKSGLETLISEFNGFANANQNSRAFGAPKAARDTANMLQLCLQNSEKLKDMRFSLWNRFHLVNTRSDDKKQIFDVLASLMQIKCSKEKARMLISQIEDKCLANADIINWNIGTSITDPGQKFLILAAVERVFTVLCPNIGRNLGNILIVYFSIMKHDHLIRNVLYKLPLCLFRVHQ